MRTVRLAQHSKANSQRLKRHLCAYGIRLLMGTFAINACAASALAQHQFVLHQSDSIRYTPTPDWPEIDSLVEFLLPGKIFPESDADVFFDQNQHHIALQVRHVGDSIWATHFWRNGTVKKRTLYIQNFIWWHDAVYCANGNLIYQGPTINQPGERRYLTYYCNGHLRSDVTLRNNFAEGHLKYWFPNGQLESDLFYSNGKANGQWQYWDQNGQLIKTETYLDDLLIDTKE